MSPPVERKPVPLSLKEKAAFGGILLVLIAAPLVGFWAYRTTSEAETVVETLVSHLERGEAEAAFAMLDPALQREVGDPAALLGRWRAAGVSGVSLSTGCASLGADEAIVRMPGNAAAGGRFALGEPSGSCGKGRPYLVHANLRQDKVAALVLSP